MDSPSLEPGPSRRARARRASQPTRDLYQVLLRAMRRRAGLSQQQLARRIGKPQSFVSKYENGERRLDVSELRTVCRALDTSLHSFVRALERSLREGALALDPPDKRTASAGERDRTTEGDHMDTDAS